MRLRLHVKLVSISKQEGKEDSSHRPLLDQPLDLFHFFLRTALHEACFLLLRERCLTDMDPNKGGKVSRSGRHVRPSQTTAIPAVKRRRRSKRDDEGEHGRKDGEHTAQ